MASDTSGPDFPMPPGVKPLPFRVGHGYDIHRLQEGGKLFLGGVLVAEGISPVAHSDGDVVLHAIVDALLGAMGWGDIGEWFSNSDERWREASSRVFLEEVFNRVRAADYYVLNLDLTVLAERPKLRALKSTIAKQVQEMTGGEVNIKAGTNEGCDAIGKGEAIACHAIVLLAADF